MNVNEVLMKLLFHNNKAFKGFVKSGVLLQFVCSFVSEGSCILGSRIVLDRVTKKASGTATKN